MLAIQGFSFYNRLFLHNELDKLYMILVAHSRRAIIDNQSHTVTFDEIKGQYTTNTNSLQKLSEGIIFGTIPGAKGPPANPHEQIRQPITFRNRRVTFYADGKVQPGTLYLTDTKKQWLYAISCPVGNISYLRRYRYEGNRWALIT